MAAMEGTDESDGTDGSDGTGGSVGVAVALPGNPTGGTPTGATRTDGDEPLQPPPE